MNRLFTSCRWHADALNRFRKTRIRAAIRRAPLPMNDSMQVKAPVVPILPLCRWHWICPWQAGMVVCHIYTAWLRMWSGKLKESLKQEQSYLFKSQEEEYAFFPEREICANKKTDWSCLKVSHNCGIENTNPLFWSRSLINFVLRLWLCKLIFSTICAYVWVLLFALVLACSWALVYY